MCLTYNSTDVATSVFDRRKLIIYWFLRAIRASCAAAVAHMAWHGDMKHKPACLRQPPAATQLFVCSHTCNNGMLTLKALDMLLNHTTLQLVM